MEVLTAVDHEEQKAQLRDLILASLQEQGFSFDGRRLIPPSLPAKADARNLHAQAVDVARATAAAGLRHLEQRLLSRIAAGSDVRPDAIRPRLIEVHRGSEEELLFRYARLHWSIPTSRGYGRRLRFIVVDDDNDKLIGLIGLCDPVFGLRDRDAWIGWSAEDRLTQIQMVMDAYVLGAVPPYSQLLGGKLVALLAASNEIRAAFTRKYEATRSVILGRQTGADLALITTVSALGRSSIYNRIRYRDELVYQLVGRTQGTGEVHFSNGLYEAIHEHALRWCKPTARHSRWGKVGFRNRREVIKKCLGDVGLSPEWIMHGLRREIYVVPTASNSREVLRGETSGLDYLDRPAEQLWVWFRERWLLPRAARDQSYADFDPETFRLWPSQETVPPGRERSADGARVACMSIARSPRGGIM